MSWWQRQSKLSAKNQALVAALASGDALDIERALVDAAPRKAETVESVIEQLADTEQAQVLRYWQRARWGQGGDTQALQEMQRVFAKGAKWRNLAVSGDPGSLPPLYPPD